MYSDVMAIDTRKFLVSVLDPLKLTLVTFVKDEGEESFGTCFAKSLANVEGTRFLGDGSTYRSSCDFLKVAHVFPWNALGCRGTS